MKKNQKWKSAEQKRQHEELQKSWQKIQDKYKPTTTVRKSSGNSVNVAYRVPPGRTSHHSIPSLSDSSGVFGSKKESQKYSGDKMLGISTLHKSNAVPVFTDTEIKEHATMRR